MRDTDAEARHAHLSAGESSGSSGLMRVMSADTVYSAAASSAVPQSSPKSARRATLPYWSCSSSRPLDIMVLLQSRNMLSLHVAPHYIPLVLL